MNAGAGCNDLLGALSAHGKCEIARDLDGTMETVGSHPVYEWHLAGTVYRIAGRAAVRQMYRLMFDGLSEFLLNSVVDQPAFLFGENHAVIEEDHRFMGASGPRVARLTAIIVFDGQLVAGERAIVGDPELAAQIRAYFGEHLEAVPGVCRTG